MLWEDKETSPSALENWQVKGRSGYAGQDPKVLHLTSPHAIVRCKREEAKKQIDNVRCSAFDIISGIRRSVPKDHRGLNC